MGTIDSTTILLTDAPVLDYYVHMNRAFLILEQNDQCFHGQDYITITINVVAYGEDSDGNLDRENAISTWTRTYLRFQINSREEPEDFPPYNLWVKLLNYWCEISLTFSFNYDGGGGGNTYVSKRSSFIYDNRKTSLVGQVASRFFSGHLRQHLEKAKEMNVWFDAIPNEYIKNDMIVQGGSSIKIINDVRGIVPNQEVAIAPAEKQYLDLITYILYHKRTPDILIDEYSQDGETLPSHIEKTFKVCINRREYRINFIGDLRFILEMPAAKVRRKLIEEGNNGN